MSATIEFIFDFASPNAYLAYRALPPILERTGARLSINPCLLGGIFKATGNVAPSVAFAAVKGKLDYEMLEIRRFIARHGIEKFRVNPHFPVNTLMLMRGYIAAREAGVEAAYLEMGLAGMWEEGLKLDDPDVLARRIDAAGLEFREPARRGSDGSRQAEACRQHRRCGRARRVRGSDLLRRRRDVLRQGAAGAGRRGGPGGACERLTGKGRKSRGPRDRDRSASELSIGE